MDELRVLPAGTPRRQSTGQMFGQAFSNVGQGIGQGVGQLYKGLQENKAIEDLLGPESKNIPREFQQMMLKGQLERQNKSAQAAEELKRTEPIRRKLEKDRGLEPGSLDAFGSDVQMAEKVTKPAKQGKQALTEKPVPVDISRKIKKIVADNPKANADDLRLLMDEAEIPPVYSNPYTENRRQTQEQQTKKEDERNKALRQETFPIRQRLAEKSMAATQGIQNKEHLMDLIEKGDIDDPTFAAIAESLPLKLGKRLLSEDTVEYKSGLVEEFGDLKNLFQGATRVKELDILEEKIADLYLTDDQKKAVLRSRINALKADQIRAEVAQELENEPLGILQFENELQKRSKPKLDALFDRILDEHKAIINDAENKKKLPLNLSDPEDIKIIDSILLEAGNDAQKAKQIAKKKGYIF